MAVILVTGGTRSGKSAWATRLAQQLAEKEGSKVTFLATQEVRDMDTRLRVAQSRKARPRSWRTLETPTGVAAALLRRAALDASSVVVVDCVTTLADNLMRGEHALPEAQQNALGIEQALQAELRAVLRLVTERRATALLVTGEIGTSPDPSNERDRLYREAVGRVNQWLASQAHEVWHVVSGIALPLHQLGTPVGG